MALNVIIPQKNIGDLRTALEDNQITDFTVAPSKSLSTFTGSLLTIDGTGNYTDFTMSANLVITFAESAHREGNIHFVLITADGTDTLTFTKPSAYNLLIPSSLTNGATLSSGSYLFSFAFIGGSIKVNLIPLASVSGDVTAPVFSNVSVDNLTTTTADFNAEIDEAGTIFWAAYPTADSQHTKAEIEAGTGATDFGSIATSGTTIETDGITGLTASTDYKVHYFGRDTATNESAATLTSEFTTASASIIAVQDNFNDNSIDTGIWGELTNGNGSTAEANQQLELSFTGAVTTPRIGLFTLNNYGTTNDLIIVQAHVTQDSNGFHTTRFAMTATQGEDTQNRALILNRNSAPFDEIRILTQDGGSVELNDNTGILFPQDIRIKYVPSTGAINFEYWNGSAWTSLGSTGNVDLGTDIFAHLLASSSAAAADIDYDDFFISNDDYSTRYPT